MSDSEDGIKISRQRTPTRRRQQQQKQQFDDDDDDDDIEFVLPNSASNNVPSSSTGITNATPVLDDVTIAPRRSSRIRNRPQPVSIRNPNRNANDYVDDNVNELNDGTPHRLEQIDCITPEDFGLDENHPSSRLKIWIHPIAMALISLHAHLSRTEVIGLLGGTIIQTPCSSPTTLSTSSTSSSSTSSQLQQDTTSVDNHGNSNANSTDSSNMTTHVIIAEAFPVQGLGDRVLAKSGRNAFSEVELDPENSVEVISRIQQKNLQVVGWYHSHPDAAFTVEPSRVDIENQANYQQLLFKDSPFVAAIVAPYNEDLPDHNADVQFFHVHENDVPLKLPFKVRCLDCFDSDIDVNNDVGSEQEKHLNSSTVMNAMKGYDFADSTRFPMEDFVAECFTLISNFWHFPKRVRLERDWRQDIRGVDKLKKTLKSIVYEMTVEEGKVSATGAGTGGDSAGSSSVVRNREEYMEGVRLVLDEVEQRWIESGQKDDERRERNRQAAKKKKRQRRR